MSIKETDRLLEIIESLRKEMIRIGIQEGITSENTIKLSQELDLHITNYQRLIAIQ